MQVPDLNPYLELWQTLHTVPPTMNDAASPYLKIAKWDTHLPGFFRIITPLQVLNYGDPIVEPFVRTYGPSLMYPIPFYQTMVGVGLIALKSRAKSTIQGAKVVVYTARAGAAKEFTFGTPIIIVEGVKDAEVMSQVWPDTLSCLTARVSEEQAFVISMLTGHVVLALDADESGRRGTRASTKNLNKFGVQVGVIEMPRGLKDPGMMMDDVHAHLFFDYLAYFRTQLRAYGVEA